LLEKIAEGGMGVVYRARQLSLNRIVAVKMIQPGRVGSPEMVLRFRAEAEAAASLHHPNIVPIHETGECEGQHYFSMDYIEGKNLAEAVREGPLPSARAAQLVAKIAEAVHYAHQHKILHRDLKPSNVILDEAGEPRVTDFGLARRLGGDSSLTLTGQVFGSPRFMPPEQASGRRGAVGPHSDVYGLGAILYYLLTARPPFVGETMETTLAQVLEQEPVSPRLLNASVPRDLETICLKCLEKEPSRRYASAQSVADELGRFLEKKPILARPVGIVGKTVRWCRRKPALATALGAVVLVAAVGFVGILTEWRRAEQHRRHAESSDLLSRRNAYAADMQLAGLALEKGDRLLALNLLDKHRPAGKFEIRNLKSEAQLATRHPPPATDLRGWEWRYLWQLCQGEELFTLCRRPVGIRTLAVSRDGKFLAIATRSGGELWDLASRQRLAESPLAEASAVAFSPAQDLLALGITTAAGQAEVGLWDAGERRIIKTLKRDAEVSCLAFSPDGRLLATAEKGGRVQVLDWQTAQVLTNFTTPPRFSTFLAFSPDGRQLAIGGSGPTRLFDLRTGTTLPLQRQPGASVVELAFSPSGDLLAVGYAWQQGILLLCDTRTGATRWELTNHTATVTGLVFTPDGQRLASASEDGTIRVWNLADGTELQRFQSSREGLTALVLLPDGKTLISGGSGGSVCLWDLAASERPSPHTPIRVSADLDAFAELEPASYTPGKADPRAVCRLGVAFTPDSRRFITHNYDGALELWETHPTRRIEPLPALGSNHWGVALSPDGRWLATGECAGSITVWDWTARRVVTNFISPFEWVCKLWFSRDGRYLIAEDFNNQGVTRVRLWRAVGWAELRLTESQSAGLWKVDVSPDDRLLAAGYGDGKVKLYRHPSGEPEAVFAGHTAAVMEVHFSPDGRWVVSTSLDGSARLWDVAARRELTPAPLRGHPGMAFGGTLSPDGQRLITGGDGPADAVKLWDPVVQRELLTLRGHGRLFTHVDFSPDGNTVVATGMRGFANVWHAPSWAEIEAAEKGAVTP
jgi:WD40 repeat protein